jgi:YcxB-like protein
MVINFRLTADDLYEGQRQFYRGMRTFGLPRLPRAFRAIFPLVMIGIGIFLLTVQGGHDDRATGLMAIGLGLIFLLFDLVLWKILAARYYNKNPSLQKDYRVQFDEEGVEYWAQDMHSKSGWSNVLRWQESENLILLYPSTRIFTMLPKRAFAPGEVDQLRELLVRKIPRK